MQGNQREGHAKAYSSVIDVAVGFSMTTRRRGKFSLWGRRRTLKYGLYYFGPPPTQRLNFPRGMDRFNEFGPLGKIRCVITRFP